MKKQNSNLPNLLILTAVLTLAFFASGCGVTTTSKTTPANTNSKPASQVKTIQNTVSKNPGSNMMDSVNNNTNTSGQVTPSANNANTGSGMMGSRGTSGMMSQYKNGTYSVNGQYFAPSGDEAIGVSLTLQNDVVTGATVQATASNRTALAYQMMFTDNFKSQVVGKKIADLNLNRVAGASLTTNGFNSAVSQIKLQAAL